MPDRTPVHRGTPLRWPGVDVGGVELGPKSPAGANAIRAAGPLAGECSEGVRLSGANPVYTSTNNKRKNSNTQQNKKKTGQGQSQKKQKAPKQHQAHHEPRQVEAHSLVQIQQHSARVAELFTDSIVNPEKDPMRNPLNTVQSAVASTFQSEDITSESYSEDKDLLIIVSPNPHTPMAMTAGASKTYAPGSAPQCSGFGEIIMKPGSNTGNLITFMQVGDNRLIAPVQMNSGTLPGAFRVTVGAGESPSILYVTFYNPSSTQLAVHIRNTPGAWSTTYINTTPWNGRYQTNIPGGTTAFAIGVARSVGTVEYTDDVDSPVHFTLSPHASSSLTFGNHAQHMILKSIPKLADYKIQRAKVHGLKVLWSFRDSKMYAAGNIITAQFPPGVFHTQYDGDNVFEQVCSARLKHCFKGEVAQGVCDVFCPPSITSLVLTSPAQSFANSGYMLIWTNASVQDGVNAKALLQLWTSFEYTTSSLVPLLSGPQACDEGTLNLALTMLARMPMCSENPHHELINSAWNWFKRNAVKVLTSKKTYYTLGEVIGAAALL